MLQKIAGIAVLAGLVISFTGSILEDENMKLAGVIILRARPVQNRDSAWNHFRKHGR